VPAKYLAESSFLLPTVHLAQHSQKRFMSYLGRLLGIAAMAVGVMLGFLTGTNPFQIVVFFAVPAIVTFFFRNFEAAVLGLLLLRSALDPFSEKGLTSAYALGLSALTVVYLTVRLLSKQKIHIDPFWWFFASWIAFQGFWVVMIAVGGTEIPVENLSGSIREWIRILSWCMAYLLTMQLKDRISPERFVNLMLLALVIPVSVAFIQLVIPSHYLPFFLAVNPNQDGFRINGTLGVANTFVTFLILFIGIIYWKLGETQNKIRWIFVLLVLTFLITTTRVLIGFPMLAILLAVLILPRLNLVNLIGTILLFGLVMIIFANTEFGQERLAGLAATPLFNPDIDVSRAILLSASDQNSFNWRIAQWHYLLEHWERSPFLGFGLQTAGLFGPMKAFAHNDYVRALVEEGLLGFLLFLAFWIVQLGRLLLVMRSSFSSALQKRFCSVLVAVLCAALAGMLTENIWSHTALFFYWFSFSAVVGWDWQPDSDTRYAPSMRGST
jgi:O-antigen ligase